MSVESGIEPRELIEKATEAGREYVSAVNAATLTGLASAFELQNAGIEAWTKAFRDGQVTATKLVQASAQLVDRAFDSK